MHEVNQWKDYLLSIVKSLPSDTDALKPLIQLIVSTLSPHRIYRLQFGGSDITPEIYTELLIVVAGDNIIPFGDLTPMFDLGCLKLQRVRCTLHSIARVRASVEQGEIFYSMHCTDKNLLYDDKKVAIPILTSKALQSMRLGANEKFLPYFERAVSFYQSAEYLRENCFGAVIAFYLHQTIELSYRAILQSLNGYFKKTHCIRSLKSLARRCAPQLNAIFPDDTANEKRLLDLLENAYTEARYETGYSIDDTDLNTLFVRTNQVIDTAQDIVRQLALDIPIKTI